MTKDTSAAEIARLLLVALQSRNIKSIANVSVPHPDHANLVEFGIPVDATDLSQGFQSLNRGEVDSGEDMPTSRGSRKRKAASERPAEIEGLADLSVMAFRFKSDSEMEVDGDDETAAVDRGWDVQIPIMEEDAGVS